MSNNLRPFGLKLSIADFWEKSRGVGEVSAELASIVPGRRVDDNAHIMLRFNNGAKGMMWASMVAAGHMQGQRIRVYGEKGSLEGVQEQPPISYVKVSGGQFRDQTIHHFDLACWLAGEALVEVYATGAALIDPAIVGRGMSTLLWSS